MHEDTQKYYFTLVDFRGASAHFADKDFDGEPVQIYEPGENDPPEPPDPPTTPEPPEPSDEDGYEEEVILVDTPPGEMSFAREHG